MHSGKLVTTNFIIFLALLLSFSLNTYAQELTLDMYQQEETAVEQDNEFRPYGACLLNFGFGFALDGGVRHTYQQITGRFNNKNSSGSNVNLRQDLGVKHDSTQFMIGVMMAWDGWRLRFDYSNAKFDGEKNLLAHTTILGTTFSQDTTLNTDLQIEVWRWLLSYTIFANHHVGLGVDLEIDAFRFDYEFQGTRFSTGTLVTEKDRTVLAVIKPGVHIDFSWTESLVFTFAVNGLIFKYNDVQVAATHVSLGGRWYIIDNFFLFGQGAYEYIKVDERDKENFDGQILLHSWLASIGVGVHF